MVTLADDGKYAVVANEGEPADDFSVDPEGSVSVVKLPNKLAAAKQKDVKTADFHAYEAGGDKTLPADVRVFGPQPHGADLPGQPQPRARIRRDRRQHGVRRAAGGERDRGRPHPQRQGDRHPAPRVQGPLASRATESTRATVTRIPAPTFDIRTFEGLHGVYMPDGINDYRAGGETYLVTANEGDAREWGDYVEASRVGRARRRGLRSGLRRQPAGPAPRQRRTRAPERHDRERLRRGERAATPSSTPSAGARSRSGRTDGEQVFDSGDEFERITHEANAAFFNSNHTENVLEGRSDDKGPEPENLSIGEVDGRTYAFIGFERVGGIAVYDITEPAASRFVTYVNNRDFAARRPHAGGRRPRPRGRDVHPRGHSPTGEPLLAVGNEVSGTTTVFAISAIAR